MHSMIFLNQMKNPFNKYFIGLIFVLLIVFIPNHKANADVSLSCKTWAQVTGDYNSVLDTYCDSWDPLVLSVSLNDSTFNIGSTITASATATFINTPAGSPYTIGSQDNEIVVKATTNAPIDGPINDLIHTVVTNGDALYVDPILASVNSMGIDFNLYYADLNGSSQFTPSTAGDYNLTYTATAKEVKYGPLCTNWAIYYSADGPTDGTSYCAASSLSDLIYIDTIKTIGPISIPYSVVIPPSVTITSASDTINPANPVNLPIDPNTKKTTKAVKSGNNAVSIHWEANNFTNSSDVVCTFPDGSNSKIGQLSGDYLTTKNLTTDGKVSITCTDDN